MILFGKVEGKCKRRWGKRGKTIQQTDGEMVYNVMASVGKENIQ